MMHPRLTAYFTMSVEVCAAVRASELVLVASSSGSTSEPLPRRSVSSSLASVRLGGDALPTAGSCVCSVVPKDARAVPRRDRGIFTEERAFLAAAVTRRASGVSRAATVAPGASDRQPRMAAATRSAVVGASRMPFLWWPVARKRPGSFDTPTSGTSLGA